MKGFLSGGILDSGITIVLNNRYGLSSRGAALVFVAAVVPSFVSGPLAGYLTDRYTSKGPVIGCLLLGAPFFVIMGISTSLPIFVCATAINGQYHSYFTAGQT